jgi:hypothetical protein
MGFEINYEGIRIVQEMEDRMNAESRETCERLDKIYATKGMQQIHNPRKYIFNPWKFE